MKIKLLWVFILALFLRVVLAFAIWHPDINNHIDWGIRFWQYGAQKFYTPETNVWSFTWPNQPPGTIYMFAGIRKLFEFLFNLFSIAHFKLYIFPGSWLLFFESNLYPALLKFPSILADLGIAYIIYKLTKKTIAPVLWLANPLIWYNSAVWGQTDAIVNFFVLLSFYLLLNKKLIWAVLAMGLSLYIKASLLIFLPIFVIIALRQKYKFSQYILAVVCSLLAIGLITLPFSRGNPLIWLYHLYTDKIFIQQLHLITANAFNLWSAVAGIHERPDSSLFLGLTYQYWSYILFSISYVPLLFKVTKDQSLKTVIWVLALTAFASFTLLTNMHERYLYPLFPYLTILVSLNIVSLYPYILISLISLLNLYNFWWYPKIDLVVNFLSFGERLIPRIFGLVNFILFLLIYREGFHHNRARPLQNSD